MSCIVFSLLFTCGLSAQEVEEERLVERFSFGVGIGNDYGFFGVKGEYKYSERIRLAAGLGILDGTVWNVGTQIHFPKFFIKDLSPYASITYGVLGSADLDNFSGIRDFGTIYGLSTGLAVYYHPIDRYPNLSFNFGVTYRWTKGPATRFMEEFNDTYDANYTYYRFNNPLPVIGIMRRFN